MHTERIYRPRRVCDGDNEIIIYIIVSKRKYILYMSRKNSENKNSDRGPPRNTVQMRIVKKLQVLHIYIYIIIHNRYRRVSVGIES